MSLRARLLLTLGVTLAVALLAAGIVIVSLVRSNLVARVDQQLLTISPNVPKIEALATSLNPDDVSGRRVALMRLDRNGRIVQSIPSGFASAPDPLPVLPLYAGPIPPPAFDVVTEVASADGSLHYRVIVEHGKKDLVIAIAAPLAGVEATTQTLIRTLGLVGGAAMVVLLLVAWIIVRRGLLPLERIAGTAEQIAGGDLSHRADVPYDGTEVGRLGLAFDTMLDQIEGAFAQQQAALAAKERSEDRLRRFVADASHELRTPLTVLRGYADLHRAGGLDDPAALGVAMDRIGTESRRMSSLVDDLLLLARLDQGRPLRSDQVDLSRIATDAVADARAVEPGRPVGGTIEDAIVVPGDEDRLRQVIGNLVANVRVHTSPATPFEVEVRRDGATAQVRVIDHGRGIDDAHKPGVFDRFYRADPGRARDSGGTGLGLSIAESIVQAHAGTIRIEDTPGGGATFVVSLPLTASSQPIPRTGTGSEPTI